MNKRHYEHTLPNIRGSLSNTYGQEYAGQNSYYFIHIATGLNYTLLSAG